MQYAKPVTLNVEECDRLFLPYLFGNDFCMPRRLCTRWRKK
ncbi:putative formate dehydrogenase formation protein [Escherichia coli P0302308.11]|nr:putative formate dehydrogenase formation protein [Escherichia coli P0302308.11]